MNLTICGLRSAVVALNVITSLSVSGILVEEQLHPVKVSASSTYSSRQAVEQLVNGAGINGDVHDSDSGANTMWHSIEKPESPIPAPGLPSSAGMGAF